MDWSTIGYGIGFGLIGFVVGRVVDDEQARLGTPSRREKTRELRAVVDEIEASFRAMRSNWDAMIDELATLRRDVRRLRAENRALRDGRDTARWN